MCMDTTAPDELRVHHRICTLDVSITKCKYCEFTDIYWTKRKLRPSTKPMFYSHFLQTTEAHRLLCHFYCVFMAEHVGGNGSVPLA